MLDRLKAEEALSQISQVSAGTGTMGKEDRRMYHASLRVAAQIEAERGVRASASKMAELGVNRTVEPGVHPGWDALRQPDEEVTT